MEDFIPAERLIAFLGTLDGKHGLLQDGCTANTIAELAIPLHRPSVEPHTRQEDSKSTLFSSIASIFEIDETHYRCNFTGRKGEGGEIDCAELLCALVKYERARQKVRHANLGISKINGRGLDILR